MSIETITTVIKTIIAVSIFFVWVVRYENIIKEFQQYNYPSWLRDLVGILKLSFAYLLMSKDPQLSVVGASGIALLMSGAFATHFINKNPMTRRLPSMALLFMSLGLLWLGVQF